MDKQDKQWEERIRFVARHYKEGAMDTGKAWKRFASERRIVRPVPFRRYILAAACALILLIGTGIFFYRLERPDWVIASTGDGERKDLVLPDSTVIALSGQSEIRYDRKAYGKEVRKVTMKGRAFFEVRHDEARPFSVQAGPAEVRVLGTSFQVKEDASAVRVDVATGKIAFRVGKENQIQLTAGMSAQYAMETNEMTVLEEQDVNYLSWKTGKLRFNNTPVEQVMEDLSDYYQIPVRSRTMLRGERLTANFDRMPLEEVLQIINQTLDIRLTTQPE